MSKDNQLETAFKINKMKHRRRIQTNGWVALLPSQRTANAAAKQTI